MTPLASSAPWWGASVIAAISALGGVLLTLIATQWRATVEMRHKDRARWDELILDRAATLLELAARISAGGQYGYPGYIADPGERTLLLIGINNEWQEALARFRLVASKSLIKAATLLYEGALTDHLGGPEKMPRGVPFLTYETSRDAFVVAVRDELRANA